MGHEQGERRGHQPLGCIEPSPARQDEDSRKGRKRQHGPMFEKPGRSLAQQRQGQGHE